MAIGWSIEHMLTQGSTRQHVENIVSGELQQQTDYPGVQVESFSGSIAGKCGEVAEEFVVTTIAWADTKYLCETIISATKQDLIGKDAVILENDINGIEFLGRGPWLRDKEKRLWGRPADFRVVVVPV